MNNEYDNEIFFEAYAKMPRSRDGLSSAGEWHQLEPLFPALTGKTLLDLGCGYGWHCKYAVEQGAAHVLGLDLSWKMIEEAEKRNRANRIQYRVCGIEEYEYPENTWDCVVSNLALHYIENIEAIFQKVHGTLKPGGIFIFNIEHPVFTAGVGQDWIYTEAGKPRYWPIDNYFVSGLDLYKRRNAAALAGRRLLPPGAALHTFLGMRRCKTTPHAYTNFDGIIE